MFNKHLPLLHGNVSILPEVRFFLPADAGNGAVQRRIFRNKRVCLPKNSYSWVASSPSQSSLCDASSPKVGALGSPRKVHLFAKASPLEERLPPRRGKMSRSDKRGRKTSTGVFRPQIKIIFPRFRRYAKYSCARRAASLMQSRSWSSVSNFLLGLR